MKTCKICGQSFPATIDYFYPAKRNRDGLNPYCRPCHRERNRINRNEWQKLNPDYYKEYREQNRDYRNQKNREWYHSHKEHHNAWKRQWRAKNKDSYNEKRRKYRRLPHIRAYDLAYSKKRYHENPEVREKNKAWGRNYKSRKRNAPGKFNARDIMMLYRASGGLCVYCENKVGTKYHIDHIIPLNRGGTNHISNLAIACPKCNCSKKDKLLSEWTHRWYEVDQK